MVEFLDESVFQNAILFAQAVKMIWIGKMNTTSARISPAPERGEPVAVDTLDFEGEMVSVMLNKSDYPDGVDSFARTMRSFGDVASSTILGDLVSHRVGIILSNSSLKI